MISIAMATFNGSLYIERQLNSILMQTVSPEEVYITDDCSSDDTVDIIQSFISTNGLENKWHLIRNEENLGYPANFYKCMSLCNGEIVFLADQDDLWNKYKIEKMTTVLQQNSEIKLLSCRHSIIDEEGRIILKNQSKETNSISSVSFERLMKEYLWPGMSMAYKKELFHDIKNFVTETCIPHDFALALAAADREAFFDFDYIGAYHRRHSNNVGREEHKISKILNFNKKLKDTEIYNKFIVEAYNRFDNLKSYNRNLLFGKKEMSQKRYNYLKNRQFGAFIYTFIMYKWYYRPKTILADIWLIITNKYTGGYKE